jgi:hypothetical protein
MNARVSPFDTARKVDLVQELERQGGRFARDLAEERFEGDVFGGMAGYRTSLRCSNLESDGGGR